ncbi:MAG: hypothetical protein HY318_10425, partial [Armatimonadetes bacterium]|nr:hypothetical protein [Armatimonadota bacterium]
MSELRRGHSSWPKRLVMAAGCCAVLIGFFAVWWLVWTNSLHLDGPPRKVPHPNAFDYYVKAAEVAHKMDELKGQASNAHRNLSAAEKKAVERYNQRVAALVHRGFSYQFLIPAVRSTDATLSTMNTNVMLRELGRRLEAQGEQMAARGQWKDAVDRYLDIIKLGVDVPHGGEFVPSMNGMAIESMGRGPLWRCLNHLSAVEVKRATQRLEKINAGRVSFSQTLVDDLHVSRATYREALKEAAWHERVMVWLAERHGMDCTKRWMSTDKQPYPIRRRKADNAFLKLMEKIPSWYGGTTDLYERLACHTATNEAKSAALAVTLALHGYHLEHGAYPNRLKELVPSYL